MASRFTAPLFDTGNGISPSDGAKLTFFITGTSTLKDTFSDEAATTPNTNPVVSDGDGLFPEIWITGSYKVTLTDKNNVPKWEEDPVLSTIATSDNDIRYSAVFGSIASILTLTTADGTAYVPVSGQSVYLTSYYTSIPFSEPQGGGGHFRVMTLAEYALTPDEVGAAFTVGGFAFVREFDEAVSVKDFGAVGNFVNDEGPAINAGTDYLASVGVSQDGGGKLHFPSPAVAYGIGTTLVRKAGVLWVGDALGTTLIKLLPSANVDLVKDLNFDAIKAGNTSLPLTWGAGISRITFDGNRQNNTSGAGLKLCDHGNDIKDVFVVNTVDNGVERTFQARVAGTNFPGDNTQFPQYFQVKTEGRYDLTIYRCGGQGFVDNGTGDLILDNLVVAQCGGEGWVANSASSQFKYVHLYSNNIDSGNYQLVISSSLAGDYLEVRDGFQAAIDGVATLRCGLLEVANHRNDGTPADVPLIDLKGGSSHVGWLRTSNEPKLNTLLRLGGDNFGVKGSIVGPHEPIIDIDASGGMLDARVSGSDGTAVEYTSGNQNFIDLIVEDSVNGLHKTVTNFGGKITLSYNTATVTNALESGSSVGDKEKIDILGRGTGSKRSRQAILSVDIDVTSTGVQTVDVPHDLELAPRIQDVITSQMVASSNNSTAWVGWFYVSLTTDSIIRLGIRTTTGDSGNNIRVGINAHLGGY